MQALKISVLILVLSLFSGHAIAQKQHGPFELNYAIDAFFGKNDRLFLSTSGGVYFSDQGGQWKKVNASFNSVYFEGKFLAATSDTLYVWDRHHGIHYTPNNGESWVNRFYFFPNVFAAVSDLAMCGDTLFVAMPQGLGYLPPAKSEGTLLPEFMNQNVFHLEAHGNRIVVGVGGSKIYVSNNRGSTWTSRANVPIEFNDFNTRLIISNNLIFIASTAGVWFSADDGITWQQKNTGLDNLFVSDIRTTEESIVLVSDKVYVSTLDAETWVARPGSGSIAGSFIAAQQEDLIIGGFDKVTRSRNNGLSWETIDLNGITNALIEYLTLDTLNKVVYASGPNTGTYRKSEADSEFVSLSENGMGEVLVSGDEVYIPVNDLSLVNAHDRTTGIYKYSFEPNFEVFFRVKLFSQMTIFLSAPSNKESGNILLRKHGSILAMVWDRCILTTLCFAIHYSTCVPIRVFTIQMLTYATGKRSILIPRLWAWMY